MNEMMFTDLLVFVGLMAVLGTVAKVTLVLIQARRHRSDPSNASLQQIAQQLEALQQAVDATSIEVERLGEGQRFTTRLLAERQDVSERKRVAERVVTPH